MSEMKSLFGQLLDTPAPPMTSTDDLLGTAHGAARRRRAGWTAAAAAGLAVLAAGTLPVVLNGHDPGTPTRQVGVGGPASTSTPASPSPGITGDPSATSPAPSGTSGSPRVGAPDGATITSGPGYQRASAALARLISLLPAGYTTPETDLIDVTIEGKPEKAQVKGFEAHPDGYWAGTDVYRDGAGGTVAATATTGAEALDPTADLCGQGIRHQGGDESCHVVVTASGVKVRLSRSPRDMNGETLMIYYAVAVYPGGTVQVQETQFGGLAQLKPLPAPIFTESQLADVAADPALRP